MLSLILVALALATVLTISHALLRSSITHAAFESGWLLRVGAALLLYGAVFLAYSRILKYFELSVLYPTYTALSILGVFLVGVLRFGEQFTVPKLIGMIAILAGVGLVAS
jgi:multidrug transporter EmrE-like cation transporter